MRQNSQTKTHTNSEDQRSSETQYLENDKKDGNSGSTPSPRLLGTNHVA
ncbi:peptide chain release factor RF2 [Neisseria sicca]|nr:peptide chain release factor RF2 [Neisseria sicca]